MFCNFSIFLGFLLNYNSLLIESPGHMKKTTNKANRAYIPFFLTYIQPILEANTYFRLLFR